MTQVQLTDAYTDFMLGGPVPEVCKHVRQFSHDSKCCDACNELEDWRKARYKMLFIQRRIATLREQGKFAK